MAKVWAVRCSHSGKYYPANYIKEWGHEIGIGLGPFPVSECWDSCYEIEPDLDPGHLRSVDDLMHPVRICGSQVDLVQVDQEEYEANKLILDRDDPRGLKRMAIIREKQAANPRSRIKMLKGLLFPSQAFGQ